MNIKKIIRPNPLKIIIFIIIIITVSIIPLEKNPACVMTPDGGKCWESTQTGIGLPKFYKIIDGGDYIDSEFSYLLLILNLIGYYTLSCLIYYTYKKYK